MSKKQANPLPPEIEMKPLPSPAPPKKEYSDKLKLIKEAMAYVLESEKGC